MYQCEYFRLVHEVSDLMNALIPGWIQNMGTLLEGVEVGVAQAIELLSLSFGE